MLEGGGRRDLHRKSRPNLPVGLGPVHNPLDEQLDSLRATLEFWSTLSKLALRSQVARLPKDDVIHQVDDLHGYADTHLPLDHLRRLPRASGRVVGRHDVEASDGSADDRIGDVSFVICLDSGCGNYDQLWCTTSLRGIVSGNLNVNIIENGVHSGDATGVVASSFRIARQLLSRIEDETSGQILPSDFHVDIPQQRIDQRHSRIAI